MGNSNQSWYVLCGVYSMCGVCGVVCVVCDCVCGVIRCLVEIIKCFSSVRVCGCYIIALFRPVRLIVFDCGFIPRLFQGQWR